MRISAVALSLALFTGSATAFTTPSTSLSVGAKTASTEAKLCACSSCRGVRTHTSLFADVAAEEVPAEVEAMDGIESKDEAHNADRPARKQLKKKKGKDLSEFSEGSMVTGKVRSITSYGAFVDIGANTDGLLHISQLASGFVSSVGDIVSEGQEVEVRIVSIDSAKGQVGLSMMTEEEAKTDAQPKRQQRQSNRRDDSAVLGPLADKGWDADTFVEGTVVSTVDFGAFVRVDAKTLNEECEGEFDGLVHISALSLGRVSSVSDIVSPEQKVQIRVKSIQGNKVSLTMLSVEDEDSKQDSFSSGPPVQMGAKDWKESCAKLDEIQPVFKNGPVVADKRK
ncbi:unnamed protein product [Cylindrotheca closterium]|uniref:S1 motif domain-containing protein n=1 Tax=Cylindrotheca closterium TaxID=2856 RepID=A0AAD2CVH1_9STRA|nr:unnamed protein product [Cylindrotheca closterium]